ncbi:hypothetical protein JHK87_018584 [Glycine soja]|nr:hypothetical protein JHK87_018584 [Glycine soja]
MVPARFWQEHNNHLRHQTETPSKLATPSLWSPSRGVSPSRAQNGIVSGLSSRFDGGSEPSVLSFAIDVSRGKVAENRIFDAHLLRLFHNRLLQWRFARADAALSAQTLNADEFYIGQSSHQTHSIVEASKSNMLRGTLFLLGSCLSYTTWFIVKVGKGGELSLHETTIMLVQGA